MEKKFVESALLALVGVVAGMTVASSCISVDYPVVSFRCDPGQSDNCPEAYFCCSDDPAAEGGALPDFLQKNISGGATPYFAGANNALGSSGMCVDRSRVPTASGLFESAALNCPIPCNPTWQPDEIDVVCGADRVCCQTTEIEAKDCVMGEDGLRPVTGADIGTLTNWAGAEHATHQDRNGSVCVALAVAAGADAAAFQDHPVFVDCIAQLTVADQRGFCIALGAGEACPTAQPTYQDACEAFAAPPPV